VEEPRRWRYGYYRWYVLAIILIGVVFHFIFPKIPALLPHIQLPAENLAFLFTLPGIGDFYLTNTLVATLVADLILLLIAFVVARAVATGELVPRGFSGAIEAFLEVIHNLTESTAGAWTKTIFPIFATISLLVLIVNWTELIPGVDSVGLFDSHHLKHPEECEFVAILPGVEALIRGDSECTSGVVPFVRVVSTDLNFTVSLALISVVWTQIIGFQALGASYFTKYWNTSTLFSKPFLGVIDWGVGILEIVSEISKILSFSFRLFGNIFAGTVLLFVIGSLVPVFAQSLFLLLEFFVGVIQAVVFGMLTMVFMSQATQAHGHGEEGAH
jgi:F-type H+-transporting ATPase subunit a